MSSYLLGGGLALLVVTAAVWDVRTRRIPNVLTVSGLAVALALQSFAGWGGVSQGLLGAGLALLILLPLFATGGVGGGDAKLLVAVGAFLGPASFLVALACTAIVGGIMALIAATRRGVVLPAVLNTGGLVKYGLSAGRTGQLPSVMGRDVVRIPYGVAIAIGSLSGWYL